MQYRVFIYLLTFTFLVGQSVQINEFVSSNGSSFYDEDGDTPDWIELYNTTDQPINLAGFGITDDPGDPVDPPRATTFTLTVKDDPADH